MHASHCTPRSIRPGFRITSIAIVLTLSACASPYAPPVPIELPRNDLVRPQELAQAITLAQQKHASYRAKLIELGESERNFSNATLAFGTVILGMATANVHSSALKGATLGTGAFYTTGLLNTDRRRGQIYLTGMATLECAVSAVQPLALNAASEQELAKDRKRLIDGMGKLSRAMAAARGQATLAAVIDSTTFAAPIKAVDDAMNEAKATMDGAARADQLVRQRLEVPTFAAVGLLNTIHGIDREVLSQVESTRPALQSIPDQLAQLKGSTLFADLAGLPTDAAGTSTTTAKSNTPHGAIFSTEDDAGKKLAADRSFKLAQDLALALGDLQAATSELKGTADRVSTTVVTTAGQTADALKACKVEGIVKPLTIAPSSVRIAAGKALTVQVVVDGGNGNLRAGFIQKPVPGLAANVPPRTVGIVEIQATDKTEAGSYAVLVEDTTLTSRVTLTVIVEASSGTDGTTPPSPDTKRATAPLSDDAIAALKKRTDLKTADGRSFSIVDITARGSSGIEVKFSATDSTITADQVEAALKKIPEITKPLGDKPDLKADRAPAEAHGKSFDAPSTVKGLPSAKVRLLQARLCMPAAEQDGVWGHLTQQALERDRAARDKSRSIPSGSLTEKERDQLMALNDDAASARCAQRAGK